MRQLYLVAVAFHSILGESIVCSRFNMCFKLSNYSGWRKLLMPVLTMLLFTSANADVEKLRIEKVNDTQISAEWFGVSDRTYFIEWSYDLKEWKFAPAIESGDGNAISYGFSASAPEFFVRLVCSDIETENPNDDDFDGDGLSNIQELSSHPPTNPLSADTDGDNIPDGFDRHPTVAGVIHWKFNVVRTEVRRETLGFAIPIEGAIVNDGIGYSATWSPLVFGGLDTYSFLVTGSYANWTFLDTLTNTTGNGPAFGTWPSASQDLLDVSFHGWVDKEEAESSAVKEESWDVLNEWISERREHKSHCEVRIRSDRNVDEAVVKSFLKVKVTEEILTDLDTGIEISHSVVNEVIEVVNLTIPAGMKKSALYRIEAPSGDVTVSEPSEGESVTKRETIKLAEVEFWQPKLGYDGEVVMDGSEQILERVSEVRVSAWYDAFEEENGVYFFNENFAEVDRDRFYIRFAADWQLVNEPPMHLTVGNASSVKLDFSKVQTDQGTYFESKGLILVVDEADDDLSLNPDYGIDGETDDRTHLALNDDGELVSEFEVRLNAVLPASVSAIPMLTAGFVEPPQYSLKTKLFLVVSEENFANQSYLNFYKNRALYFLEETRRIYLRVGIDYPYDLNNVVIKKVSQTTWNQINGDGRLSQNEARSIIDGFEPRDKDVASVVFYPSELEGTFSTAHGYSFGRPVLDTNHYGYAFVSLEGSVEEYKKRTVAHELGHLMGHYSKSALSPKVSYLRDYPPSNHVDKAKTHNLLVSGIYAQDSVDYRASKRLSPLQRKLFITSEFIEPK